MSTAEKFEMTSLVSCHFERSEKSFPCIFIFCGRKLMNHFVVSSVFAISLKRQSEKLDCVIEHDLLTHFRLHVDLLELFKPALDADGGPIGAEHRFVLQ